MWGIPPREVQVFSRAFQAGRVVWVGGLLQHFILIIILACSFSPDSVVLKDLVLMITGGKNAELPTAAVSRGESWVGGG